MRSTGLVALSLLAVALFALSGCGSSNTADSGGGGSKGKGRGRGGNAGPVPVVVATAVEKDVPIDIQAVGTVEAYNTISVKSQVSGQLTSLYFKEGDYVKKGDKLFTVDSRPYEAQLAQAQANLAKDTAQLGQAQANLARDTASQKYAQDTAARYQKLVAEGIVSKDQSEQVNSNASALAQAMAADKAAIESARAQMLADQANIENIKVQLGYTTVYSPIDGRTGNVSVKVGNIVNPNTVEVVTINQVQPIYVTFAVPEARLAEIKRYMATSKLPVTALPQDGSENGERGVLTFIDNAVDTSTGTIKLKGTFENQGLKLWPGQFLNVSLRLTTQPNAITVPNQAVQNGQDGQFIYVVNSNHTVEVRNVTTGPRIGEDLVILKGINPGDVVVTEGQLRLQPGSTVQFNGGGRRGPGGSPNADYTHGVRHGSSS
jgi:multidrug efflux system membrane fusion protein